jgi:uncharacterized protein YjbI with pentapeptide repeats
MADSEHLAKIKAGVEAWNDWRKANPGIVPDLRNADLGAAELSGADLSRAKLRRAYLRKSSLKGTNLQRANLQGANIRRADLSGADFRWAHFGGTDLSRANLSGADLTEAIIYHTTFGDNDLSDVKGLDAARHKGPSTIGIDTIYRSKGEVPESFLRGCGVPDEFIARAKSLATGPSEFYSCFISYSSKDDAFATELHATLQAQHVRCWKDSEDLKIGDSFQDVIGSAIWLHDKLLLVLSENSINSSWVEWEVRKALKKEQEQSSTVLFPVRLDDAVMEAPYAWAAEVRKRHIGDFRSRNDHDSFQKSLDRLLRDLKSQESKPR